MRFRVSGSLLRFTEFQKEIDVDAPTIKGGIDALVAKYPELGKVLYDRMGQIRATHRIFLNGDAVTKEQLGREAAATDVVDIMTAITGG